jgi:hypothetical protein
MINSFILFTVLGVGCIFVVDGTYVNSKAVVIAMGVDTNGNKYFIGYVRQPLNTTK